MKVIRWIGMKRQVSLRVRFFLQSFPSNDVKLRYIKTLVTGKAKLAIEDFAYSGRMYRDDLRVIEQKIGQNQNVVSTHLEILKAFQQKNYTILKALLILLLLF